MQHTLRGLEAALSPKPFRAIAHSRYAASLM